MINSSGVVTSKFTPEFWLIDTRLYDIEKVQLMSVTDKDFSSSTVGKYGWNLNEYNHSTPFKSHFIYVTDYHKNKTWMISIAQEDFNKTKVSTSLNFEVCVGKLGQILKKMSTKMVLTQAEEAALAPLLTNYIKQTLTYREWLRRAEVNSKLHFLINIYGIKAGKDEVVLRPFIVESDSVMHTPEEVIEFNSQVNKIDLQRHPEWFR